MFLEICGFHLGYPIYWCITVVFCYDFKKNFNGWLIAFYLGKISITNRSSGPIWEELIKTHHTDSLTLTWSLCSISCNFFSFIFCVGCLRPLSFFLDEPSRRLIDFIFKKTQLLFIFPIFCLCFIYFLSDQRLQPWKLFYYIILYITVTFFCEQTIKQIFSAKWIPPTLPSSWRKRAFDGIMPDTSQ